MMKTIYYALMLVVSCLFVLVFTLAINAGLDGYPMGWFLAALMTVFAVAIHADAISIIDEEDEMK